MLALRQRQEQLSFLRRKWNLTACMSHAFLAHQLSLHCQKMHWIHRIVCVWSEGTFQSSGSGSANTLGCQCHCSPAPPNSCLALPWALSSLLHVSKKHALTISRDTFSSASNGVRKSQVSISSSLDLLSPCHHLYQGSLPCSPGLNAAMYEVSGYLQLTGVFPSLVTNNFLYDFCINMFTCPVQTHREPILPSVITNIWWKFECWCWVGEHGVDNGERREIIVLVSLENSSSQIKPKFYQNSNWPKFILGSETFLVKTWVKLLLSTSIFVGVINLVSFKSKLPSPVRWYKGN